MSKYGETVVKAIDLEDSASISIASGERYTGVSITAVDHEGRQVVLTMDKRLVAGFFRQGLDLLHEQGVRAQKLGVRDVDYILKRVEGEPQ